MTLKQQRPGLCSATQVLHLTLKVQAILHLVTKSLSHLNFNRVRHRPLRVCTVSAPLIKKLEHGEIMWEHQTESSLKIHAHWLFFSLELGSEKASLTQHRLVIMWRQPYRHHTWFIHGMNCCSWVGPRVIIQRIALFNPIISWRWNMLE